MDAPTELELARRATEGDHDALDALWREHRRWIAVVLMAHMPAEAELEDLLQDVALNLLKSVSRLNDPARLRPWLRSVTLNTARSAGRKASVRRRWMRPLSSADLEIAGGESDGGALRLETRLTAEKAMELAQELPPDYREALLLRSLEGMTQRQIADTLELPETTIESRLARARRMLRQRLSEPTAATHGSLTGQRAASIAPMGQSATRDDNQNPPAETR